MYMDQTPIAPRSSDQLAESLHPIKLFPTKMEGDYNGGKGVGQQVNNKRNSP